MAESDARIPINARSPARARADDVLLHLKTGAHPDRVPQLLKSLSRSQRLRILDLALVHTVKMIGKCEDFIARARRGRTPGIAKYKGYLNYWNDWRKVLIDAQHETRKLIGRGRPSTTTSILGGIPPHLITYEQRESLVSRLKSILSPISGSGRRILRSDIADAIRRLGVRVSPRSVDRVLATMKISVSRLTRRATRQSPCDAWKQHIDQIAEILRIGPAKSHYHIGSWQSTSLQSVLERHGHVHIGTRNVRRVLHAHAMHLRRQAASPDQAAAAPRLLHLADSIDPDVLDRASWTTPGPERQLSRMTGADLRSYLAYLPRAWDVGDGEWTLPLFISWLHRWWYPKASRNQAQALFDAWKESVPQGPAQVHVGRSVPRPVLHGT